MMNPCLIVLKQGDQPVKPRGNKTEGSEPNPASAFPVGHAELAANSCLLGRNSTLNTDIYSQAAKPGIALCHFRTVSNSHEAVSM